MLQVQGGLPCVLTIICKKDYVRTESHKFSVFGRKSTLATFMLATSLYIHP